MSRVSAPVLACLLVALAGSATGCGEGGISAGAVVTVYVEAPLCQGARHQLKQTNGGVGEVEVRAVCLPAVESRDRLDLATAGENARSASEDSTAVAYLGPPGPAAKFTGPVLDAAEIAVLRGGDVGEEMGKVLDALRDAEADPRDAVFDTLG
ncbi:MAG TPA: hypothetical protein VFM51_04365 [Solirubrobacterales bacterium]|nr:hypothetical protein [Solirubrobacterales bacterium]